VDDNDLDLKQMSSELESLKLRVAKLEVQFMLADSYAAIPTDYSSNEDDDDHIGVSAEERAILSTVAVPPKNAPNQRLKRDQAVRSAVIPQTSAHYGLSENFIGGKLLNRIGALIVVSAVAYFLKWSFDNNIIGELGRCVLGLAAGIGMMAAGQIYLKRGYATFSQGLTGAGIAIIYLSAYAAVNYYHLISPYMAFALMFLTSLTAGIMAVAGDMSGTAVMATVGGFLVPFLMGSHTGQIVPLLTYILILDLGILFMAYYRQWFFLDVIALIGTALVALAAYNMEWQIWYGQAFLTIYMVLFIVVAALYNHRTRNNNPLLLLASCLMFGIFTFANLYLKMHDWLGLVSLCMAAIYLGTFLVLRLRSTGTIVFSQTVLILALIFSFLAPPAQLHGIYNQMAWLAIAAASLYFSRSIHSTAAFVVGIIIILTSYFAITPEIHPQPVLNRTTLLFALSAADWLLALWVAVSNYPREKKLAAAMAAIITGIVFYLLHYDINNAIYFYRTNQSFAFLIPISWAVISSLVLWLGVHRDDSSIRLFSLLLYGIVIVRTIFYDLRQLDIVYKIMVLMVIGLIALAISFFYQRRMKGDELQ
jgi:Predicted membrane protein